MRHGIFTDRQSDDQVVVESSSQLSLREIFPAAQFFAGKDIQFDTVAESSSTCNEGELVVYRIGHDDPMQLVADALARGAVGILTEQLLPCPLPQCIVGDIEIALGKVAAIQLDRPDRKLLTIGVIGSAGKTTTSLLISNLLRASGYRTAYQTDLGDCDGIVQKTSKQTIPDNSSLVRWIGDAVDAGCQAAVIEMSDASARRGGYDAIEIDILVVTGTGIRQTDFGPSGVQCGLDRLASDGIVIVPSEDQKTQALIRDAGAKPLTYSVRKAADMTAKIFEQSGGITTLMVNHHNTTALMETSLCGAENADNHLAATLVGLLLGHPIEQIVENLSKLREVPGRGQRLIEYGQATVVIDAGGTPDRAASALRTHRSMKANGRLWCILAIDANDSPETLSQYGTLMERFADQPIVTAGSGAKKSFMSASHNVLDGVQDCAAMRLVADRRRAIEWAMSQSKPDDTILIITGGKDQTAHQQRVDIELIQAWVATSREAKVDATDAVTLKIFK